MSLRPTLCLLLLTLAIQAQQRPTTSKPSSSSAKLATLEPGEITNGVYRNPSFEFSYRLRFGWVDRTQDMNQDSGDAAKSRVLLGIFERPPQATGSSVNSAVVIAVEPASSYPGLTSAAQYFGPLTEVSTAKGLKAINQPYEFPVDAKPIVRRDFTKSLGGGSMHQSTLALLTRGYIISFTFIGGSDDEVTALIESLSFGKIKRPPHP